MSDGDGFRLLVLADVHFGPRLEPREGPMPKHRPELGLELVRRGIADAKRRGGFDCIALMGDLVDDGQREDTAARLAEIRDAVAAGAPGVPTLVAPGNHDCSPAKLFEIFHTRGGLHEIGGCRFVVLVDALGEGGVWVRGEDQRELMWTVARRDGGPLVVLHHNPINLAGEWGGAFMVANHEQVMRDYAAAGVWLCIGAHCHAGQDLNEAGGVLYFTAPCLCVPPFPYVVITMREGRVAVDARELGEPTALGGSEQR